MMVPVSQPTGTGCLVVLRADPEPPPRDQRNDVAARRTADDELNRRFQLAARLLQLIAHDTASERKAARGEEQLCRARLAVTSHEHEEERLRRLLGCRLPDLRGKAACTVRSGCGHEVVRRLVETVRRDFARPLVLRHVARQLGMNADYLSSLFSREVGVPFKSYVTTLRMQRAQELLSDPARRVSEVGFAVGYATARRFRAAFRSSTGLPPGQWRRTLKSR